MKTHFRMIASAAVLALSINGAAFAARGDAGYPPVPAPKPTIAEEPADMCASFYGYAYEVMYSRQLGGSLPRVFEINRSVPELSKGDLALLDKIAMAAYGEPRYSTPDFQERAAVDFANDVYLICATETNQR